MTGAELQLADLRDPTAVEQVVRAVRPEAVYHLAPQASSRQSLDDAWGTIGTNLHAQTTLFDALLLAGLRPGCLVVGSSDEYGSPDSEHLPTDGIARSAQSHRTR